LVPGALGKKYIAFKHGERMGDRAGIYDGI
jgi:hypothetical protein